MNDMKKLDIKSLGSKLTDLLQLFKRYSMPIFLSIVAIVYGFIFFQINSLGNTEPSDEAITSLVKKSQSPKIDPEVVKQIEALEDNSVNVQTLFNNARSDPFQ